MLSNFEPQMFILSIYRTQKSIVLVLFIWSEFTDNYGKLRWLMSHVICQLSYIWWWLIKKTQLFMAYNVYL